MGVGPGAGRPTDGVQGDLAAIVRSSADAILSKTLDGIITSWNTGAQRLYGYTPEEVVGQPVSILVPPDAIDELPTIFERLRAGMDVPTYETRRRRKDGSIVAVSLSVSPIHDRSGTVIGASAIARDITETRREAARTARLLEVTAGLSGAMTVDAVVRASTELAVRAMEAAGAVFVVLGDHGDTVRLLGVAGYENGYLDAWDEWPLSDLTPVNEAIREGRLVAVESPEEFKERYPDAAPALLSDTVAAVAIPMSTEGRAFGALGLRFVERRRFTAGDRDELRGLGGQCAIALERARLFEAERAARDRLTFLSQAGEALAGSLEVDEVLGVIARLAVPRLADWCGVSLVQEDRSVRRSGFHHVDPSKIELGETWWRQTRTPADQAIGAPNVIRTGRPEVNPEVTPELLRKVATPDDLRVLESIGITSSMVVPLVARERTIGAVTLVMGPSGRSYSARDLDLAQDLARRAALAADNARLFAERVHVSRRLQDSLLPRLLPAIPGVSLAAEYLAAGEGTEVGGDFYDVFALGGDAWALVIGDVCGKGADAAGVTALARYTLRALAPNAASPAHALVEVNDAVVRQNVTDERFLTAAYGMLHPDGGHMRLTLALAGHPQPVLVQADGSVSRIGTPGTLLGVFPTVSLSDTVVDLGPGDTLVLFTDGVTEAHGVDGLFGDERLESVLRSLAGAPANAVAAGVADAVVRHRAGGTSDDDMAVLVVRVD